MTNKKTETKYQLINNKKLAICSECYKNNITTALIEDWKPYDNEETQSNFYYTCPIHTEISIVTKSKLPIKK